MLVLISPGCRRCVRSLFTEALPGVAMTDTDAEEAVEEFLRKAEAVYSEYDKGYVDADASLRQLRGHIETLREATEDE